MAAHGLPLGHRLKLRHLTLLDHIARHGSLTRVAAATGITQPAATKALAELEDIFGAPLFTRAARGLQPTPLGELAIVRARQMLHDIEHWGREVEALHAGHSAHLELGAVPDVPGGSLAQAIAALFVRHRVTLTVQRAGADHLLQRLQQRELDCVIGPVAAAGDATGLTHTTLYRRKPALIAHSRLAARLRRRAPTWAELATMNWVLPSPGMPIRQVLVEQFVRADVAPPVPVLETDWPDVIEGMLTADQTLLSLVPEDVAVEMCQRSKVAIVPRAVDAELPPVSLIGRLRGTPLAAEAHLAAILIASFAGPPGGK